jgi:hypothetical protein
MDKLRHFHLDKLSFWIGCFTGILLWWIGSRLRINKSQAIQLVQQLRDGIRRVTQSSIERNYRLDVLKEAQHKHLAASLFSLDEICVTPRLIAPPIRIELVGPILYENVTDQIVPYIPDWPELASATHVSTLSMIDAVKTKVNLVIFGKGGLGKTTALCYLASEIVNKTHSEFSGTLPILVHAGNLLPNIKDPHQILTPIINAVGAYCSPKTQNRLHSFITTGFELQRALILLDGLDEMNEPSVDALNTYIGNLLDNYPGTRFIVTASNEYIGSLHKLGFISLTLAPWNQEQKNIFLNKWEACWEEYINPLVQKDNIRDPTLIREWLLSSHVPCLPLEFALKTWASFADDSSGPCLKHSIEDFIQRVSNDRIEDIKALEKLALQSFITKSVLISLREIDQWEFKLEDVFHRGTAGFEMPQPEASNSPSQPISQVKVSHSLPILIENGLVWTTVDGNISIIHPTITAFLAAKSLQRFGSVLKFPRRIKTLKLDHWGPGTETIEFLVSLTGEPSYVEQVLEQNTQPLNRALLVLARSLTLFPNNSKWRISVLRKLAIIIQDDHLSIEMRAKALTALVLAGDNGIKIFIKDMLISEKSTQRFLGALGISLSAYAGYTDQVISLIQDPNPTVQCAACLGLFSIGNKKCIDTLAEALLHGNEELQRAAAETLAIIEEDGQQILREAVEIEDVLVRRAVIFGLLRLRSEWAITLLEKLQIEDSQWVVKDAAIQALESINETDPHLPSPYKDPSDIPWLIAYAGERGQGISPGSESLNLFLSALEDGNNDQKIAAIDYIKQYGDASVIPVIRDIFTSSSGELKSAAFLALWYLSLSGHPI